MTICSTNLRSPYKGLSKSDCVQEKLIFHSALKSLFQKNLDSFKALYYSISGVPKMETFTVITSKLVNDTSATSTPQTTSPLFSQAHNSDQVPRIFVIVSNS